MTTPRQNRVEVYAGGLRVGVIAGAKQARAPAFICASAGDRAG